ncbi:hypothetical protein ROHU_022131 [Labeo rohita]|uniref:Uncharacterized protein n=1 Tax=Labeo rohita TaxID=84645 RepID=A0A498MYM9_LABRO|nr:hypothetical protein ROHU_022131 [Labeo rohita]
MQQRMSRINHPFALTAKRPSDAQFQMRRQRLRAASLEASEIGQTRSGEERNWTAARQSRRNLLPFQQGRVRAEQAHPEHLQLPKQKTQEE